MVAEEGRREGAEKFCLSLLLVVVFLPNGRKPQKREKGERVRMCIKAD